eukprot:CAMPEP_0167811714 /NCGR_PEP_ID=MMETSP0112_2-20121227/830_1 /TAXON_ID=91324 /ORGANISM="Lotharella globosa, Strain CCCM811" /LENGTH=113 /DNA_ID=CAMNT_0007710473 /DNA_START=926 /DNA_END=1267 /DNA_ORIENTATION=-
METCAAFFLCQQDVAVGYTLTWCESNNSLSATAANSGVPMNITLLELLLSDEICEVLSSVPDEGVEPDEDTEARHTLNILRQGGYLEEPRLRLCDTRGMFSNDDSTGIFERLP